MLRSIKNRWQAFATHLAISLLIFIIIFAIITLYWYPGVFIQMGGWQGIKIIAAVDLVLGPVLTLIVFNRKKKSLKWDLTAVGVFQFSCLAYGLWVVESQRPVVQVLINDTVYVVAKSELQETGKMSDISNFKGPYPKFVILDMENDHALTATTLVTAMFSGTPLQSQTDKYLDARNSENNALTIDKLDWNFRNLQIGTNESCSPIQTESQHYSGKSCINRATGLTTLER